MFGLLCTSFLQHSRIVSTGRDRKYTQRFLGEGRLDVPLQIGLLPR
jgi:hypothetical protein